MTCPLDCVAGEFCVVRGQTTIASRTNANAGFSIGMSHENGILMRQHPLSHKILGHMEGYMRTLAPVVPFLFATLPLFAQSEQHGFTKRTEITPATTES